MATGGGDFGYDDPILNRNIDNDGDEAVQQVLDNTQPFEPGQASTPRGVEQYEMQTMPHEQSGLPDISYAEVPLLVDFLNPEEKQNIVGRTIDFIKNRFPKADLKKIGPISFGKKTAALGEIVLLRPKGGKTPIFKKDGSGFLKSFTDKFSKSLGPSAEQIMAEDRETG